MLRCYDLNHGLESVPLGGWKKSSSFFHSENAITWKILKSFMSDFDFMTLLSLALSLLFTYLCERYDLFWDIQLSIIVSPVIFPLAFSIISAYQRREKVLSDLALFKSAALTTYFCHRDWAEAAGVPPSHSVQVRQHYLAVMEVNQGNLCSEDRIFCAHGCLCGICFS